MDLPKTYGIGGGFRDRKQSNSGLNARFAGQGAEAVVGAPIEHSSSLSVLHWNFGVQWDMVLQVLQVHSAWNVGFLPLVDLLP